MQARLDVFAQALEQAAEEGRQQGTGEVATLLAIVISVILGKEKLLSSRSLLWHFYLDTAANDDKHHAMDHVTEEKGLFGVVVWPDADVGQHLTFKDLARVPI